jgi:phosphoribosylanthranilate isomerase
MIRVKICGITRLEDALFAQDSGADALGFIFYSSSKRYIDPEEAAEITGKLNPFLVKIGVFVNESTDRINDISVLCGLTHVQLHGDENPQIVSEIKRKVIKAINFSDNILDEIKKWRDHDLLIDSGTREIPGGTGKTLPWQELKNLNISKRFILAGGLNINNVAQGIKMLNPLAVDVSSGVEISPGIKDNNLVKRFIEKVKGI